MTENELHGRTMNPWSAKHVPGGSTGGGAAAVAAGMGPLTQGSDNGGSIRIRRSAQELRGCGRRSGACLRTIRRKASGC